MDRLRPVRTGVLVVAAVVAAGWLGSAATARVAVQATPGAGTPGSAATPTGPGAASPYLAGDALPLLPPGRPGVVDVIAVGAPEEWSVPVVLRNNTDEPVVLTTVHGAAHETTGTPIATGGPGSAMSPTVLPPGQVAIAVVYFNSLEHLPPDAALAFQPETEPLATARVFQQDLEIVEARRGEQAIVGLARNGTEGPLVGRVTVVGVCFDPTGAVTGFSFGFADALDLDPGETAPFEVPFAGTGPCEAFLVGANGFRKL